MLSDATDVLVACGRRISLLTLAIVLGFDSLPSLSQSFSLQTRNVRNTSVRLDRLQSLQGCNYEARVRARVSAGQWSHWFPAASGKMEKGDKKENSKWVCCFSHQLKLMLDVCWPPAVGGGRHAHPIPRCVLLGQAKVECSWSVSAEVPWVISHQLLCRRNRTTL